MNPSGRRGGGEEQVELSGELILASVEEESSTTD